MMIAKLRGVLDECGDDWAIVDVGGVGYMAFCSARSLSRMPAVGEPVTLLIEMQVREDHIHLFGFLDAAERDWFRLLQSVQGVGAKVALAVLSVATPLELGNAIAAQDKTTVSRASGVGPKLAARIVNELKDKVAKLAIAPVSRAAAGSGAAVAAAPEMAGAAVVRDAASALSNLGYRPADAYGAVSAVAHRLGAERPLTSDDLQELIRQGLKELAR
jgi:Holliday junction DNA helicase RuvA